MTESDAIEALGADLDVVPDVPAIAGHEWGDWPCLMICGKNLSPGWQRRPEGKGGPCFLVGRQTAMGSVKVAESFPYTKVGWAQAWRYLVAQDATLEKELRADLVARAAVRADRQELAGLDAATLVGMKGVILLGGYAAGSQMPAGKPYDLRFTDSALLVMSAGVMTAVLEIAYREIEEIEVGGPGLVSRFSRGQQAGLTVAFGLLGAAVAYSDTRIQTVVRVHAVNGELFFLNTATLPDVLRIELSRPLGAIREARAAGTTPSAGVAAAVSVVAELRELASMLAAELVTREEFDQLKAQLLG